MKEIVLYVGLFFCGFCLAGQNSVINLDNELNDKVIIISSPDAAVAVATDISVLTQKIYKSYIYKIQGLRGRSNKDKMIRSIKVLEEKIYALSHYALVNNQFLMIDKINQFEAKWSNHKSHYESGVEFDIGFFENNYNIMMLSKEIVSLALQSGGSKFSRMVVLCGQQMIHLQRISTLYALMSVTDSPTVFKEYNETINVFSTNINEMSLSRVNTDAISKLFESLSRNFSSFQRVANLTMDYKVPALIDHSADKILIDLIEVSNRYSGRSREYGLSRQ